MSRHPRIPTLHLPPFADPYDLSELRLDDRLSAYRHAREYLDAPDTDPDSWSPADQD